MTDMAIGQAAHKHAGRSLWADAWMRLKANRAAMASIVFLVLIALACIFGPPLAGHDFSTIYKDYNSVPPSLTTRPDAPAIESTLRDVARKARLELVEWNDQGGQVTAKLKASKPVDERVTRYFDRTNVFKDTAVSEKSADGLSVTLNMHVNKLRFLLGTDSLGRDLLTRSLIAGRVSLSIGLLAGLVAVIIGVLYGAASGFLGGKTDEVMMRIVDILYSLPFIFFVIMLVVFFGRNFILMFIAVGAVMWLDMARIVRGQALSLKRQEFVQAAEALGVTSWGILLRHVVPNLLGPVAIYMTLLVPQVIILESFLSYLGLGVQEPLSSWGVLISQGKDNMEGAWWMLLFPSLLLTTTLFALNFLGDGLRDALDPKDR